jgi:hypothetical protein
MNVNTLIKSLQGNAVDLGISWDLIPGTVTKNGDGLVNVRVDADESNTIIQAISLVGSLAVDTRVMLLAVPPSTLFIVGRLAATSGYLTGSQVEYTATGSFLASTYPGMRGAIIEMIAGGGGGGFAGAAAAGNAAAGGGGGGGTYGRTLATAATLSDFTWTVTIGAAGTGGTSAAIDGTTGGTSSFVTGSTTLVSVLGGQGGESVSASTGAVVAQGGNAQGTATADFSIIGSPGMNGYHGASFAVAGNGGPAGMWGVVTRGNGTDGGGTPTAAAANTGSGGAGAHSNPGGAAFNGGDGAAGRALITILY